MCYFIIDFINQSLIFNFVTILLYLLVNLILQKFF